MAFVTMKRFHLQEIFLITFMCVPLTFSIPLTNNDASNRVTLSQRFETVKNLVWKKNLCVFPSNAAYGNEFSPLGAPTNFPLKGCSEDSETADANWRWAICETFFNISEIICKSSNPTINQYLTPPSLDIWQKETPSQLCKKVEQLNLTAPALQQLFNDATTCGNCESNTKLQPVCRLLFAAILNFVNAPTVRQPNAAAAAAHSSDSGSGGTGEPASRNGGSGTSIQTAQSVPAGSGGPRVNADNIGHNNGPSPAAGYTSANQGVGDHPPADGSLAGQSGGGQTADRRPSGEAGGVQPTDRGSQDVNRPLSKDETDPRADDVSRGVYRPIGGVSSTLGRAQNEFSRTELGSQTTGEGGKLLSAPGDSKTQPIYGSRAREGFDPPSLGKTDASPGYAKPPDSAHVEPTVRIEPPRRMDSNQLSAGDSAMKTENYQPVAGTHNTILQPPRNNAVTDTRGESVPLGQNGGNVLSHPDNQHIPGSPDAVDNPTELGQPRIPSGDAARSGEGLSPDQTGEGKNPAVPKADNTYGGNVLPGEERSYNVPINDIKPGGEKQQNAAGSDNGGPLPIAGQPQQRTSSSTLPVSGMVNDEEDDDETDDFERNETEGFGDGAGRDESILGGRLDQNVAAPEKPPAQNAPAIPGESVQVVHNAMQYNFKDEQASSGHFMAYFITAVVLCVAGYVIYHNKQKIFAIALEGRRDNQRRRPTSGGDSGSSAKYSKLQSSVEEVVPSLEKSTTSKNYIY